MRDESWGRVPRPKGEKKNCFVLIGSIETLPVI